MMQARKKNVNIFISFLFGQMNDIGFSFQVNLTSLFSIVWFAFCISLFVNFLFYLYIYVCVEMSQPKICWSAKSHSAKLWKFLTFIAFLILSYSQMGLSRE